MHTIGARTLRMRLREKSEKLSSRHNAVKYDFIVAELDLAITFCDVALASQDQTKLKRNSEHARRAYKSAKHFLENADFSSNMKDTVHQKISKLKTMLRRVDRREFKTVAL